MLLTLSLRCRASYTDNWPLYQVGKREVRVPSPREADERHEGGGKSLDSRHPSAQATKGPFPGPLGKEPLSLAVGYSQASFVSGVCLACFPFASWDLVFASSHPMLKAAAEYHPYLWRKRAPENLNVEGPNL